MALIQGLAAHAAGAELLPFRYDPGELGMQEVEIGITHCGICHSDLHLISNDWGISQYPFIPGHEIIGTITAVGSRVRSLKVGERVGLGWQSNSCGECEWCSRGLENLCASLEATCVHRNGGYANSVRANSRFVMSIPGALPSEQAAPLLCGGITVYSPMRDHGINPSSRVGVVGIGGLGHIAIQFARVFGAEVIAFSTSTGKEEEARALGAHHFVHSRESKSMKEVAGSLDFILNTANADQDWNVYIQALRPTGTLCFVGVPPSPVSVQAFPLIGGIRTVTGSPIGSPQKIREMLDVAARHGVKATTEAFSMAKANDAIEKVKKNKVRYRAVLSN
ncbi:NAD(P)-dependent alcohol dehydrogenase [Telmatobacter sp. DSM 110680]|uniref:alcohol dehydrogenase (NADP(+)) n=1 Tax=Telmatobacter sp. DSM 110680 TaxID=3036704 RepID=A0AAU7DDE7_9BACT